jgi:hypothetical protein
MHAESKIENSIPLLERDVEAQDGELDKRNDDEPSIPAQSQAQSQASARKKFLIWTAIK